MTVLNASDALINSTNESSSLPNGQSGPEIDCILDLSKAELPILLILCLVFNSFSIIILVKIRSDILGIDYLLVLTLAVNDFVTMALFTVMWIGGWIRCKNIMDVHLCSFFGWLATTMVIWSAWVVIIMAGCRYLATVKPLYYRSSVTRGNVIIVLVFTLFFTLLQLMLPFTGLAAPYVFYDENRICAYNFSAGIAGFSHRIILGVLATEGLLATIVIMYFNISIIYVLRRVNVVRPEPALARPDMTSNNQTKRTAFANVTKVVSAVYCICYAPFLVRLLYDVIDNTPHQNDLRHSISMTLLFMSPLLNPMVYVACNRRYREYIVQTCKNMCKCGNKNKGNETTGNDASGYGTQTTRA
ncbi:Rhodopsin, GQ-coupled [Mizuhopecten yessoensis]|uniref:Rhodopsin, GQ-coupled n=1 Tax=Mizuhopecten yessoensis TaxID=6573 RepID=A0A210PFV3_MIZYE|nr:Rhodopsin, GQ-coupled [Mizuhopecten yessoensis]